MKNVQPQGSLQSHRTVELSHKPLEPLENRTLKASRNGPSVGYSCR